MKKPPEAVTPIKPNVIPLEQKDIEAIQSAFYTDKAMKERIGELFIEAVGQATAQRRNGARMGSLAEELTENYLHQRGEDGDKWILNVDKGRFERRGIALVSEKSVEKAPLEEEKDLHEETLEKGPLEA